MPCTLEPWEAAVEERSANRAKYGVEVTDAEMLTRVSCEFARRCEGMGLKVIRSNGFSKEAVDWWKRHKAWDAKREKAS